MAITDSDAKLRELANLHYRHELMKETLEQRIFALWQAGGFSLEVLGAAIGKSASQTSRILARLEESDRTPRGAQVVMTAMELVRQAQRGVIDHDDLVALLKNWRYDATYTTRDESDDWEVVDNSFDAVYHAYVGLDLLTDKEYEEIERVAR